MPSRGGELGHPVGRTRPSREENWAIPWGELGHMFEIVKLKGANVLETKHHSSNIIIVLQMLKEIVLLITDWTIKLAA